MLREPRRAHRSKRSAVRSPKPVCSSAEVRLPEPRLVPSRACKPKPASRLRGTVKKRATAHRFAFCPPVLLVRRASSFCPASASGFLPPTGLSTVRRPRHAMCPTDVCHSNDLLHPHLAHSRLSLPTCIGRTLRGVSGLRTALPGERTFHDVRTASADRIEHGFTSVEHLVP